MITNFKIYEGSGFGESYPGHIEPTPEFKIGDEVIVMYDLKQNGLVKGDIVTITDFWIYANGSISYRIDSPKLREIKKGMNTRYDDFSEFHFEYEWKVNAKKYNM